MWHNFLAFLHKLFIGTPKATNTTQVNVALPVAVTVNTNDPNSTIGTVTPSISTTSNWVTTIETDVTDIGETIMPKVYEDFVAELRRAASEFDSASSSVLTAIENSEIAKKAQQDLIDAANALKVEKARALLAAQTAFNAAKADFEKVVHWGETIYTDVVDLVEPKPVIVTDTPAPTVVVSSQPAAALNTGPAAP